MKGAQQLFLKSQEILCCSDTPVSNPTCVYYSQLYVLFSGAQFCDGRFFENKKLLRTSLVVQWFRLSTSSGPIAGAQVWSPVRELGSHMPHMVRPKLGSSVLTGSAWIMKVRLCALVVFAERMKRSTQLLRGGEVRLRPRVSLTWAVSLPNHRSESQRKELEIENLWAIIHSSCNYSEDAYCICMFPQ